MDNKLEDVDEAVMLINREILETVGDRLLGEGAMSRIRRRLATVRVHNEHEVTQAGTERRGEKASLRDGLPTPSAETTTAARVRTWFMCMFVSCCTVTHDAH